jgi:hypothetical protein
MTIRRRFIRFAVTTLTQISAAGILLLGPALANDAQTADAEDNGVKIQWRYTPESGAERSGVGTLEVALSDARSGQSTPNCSRCICCMLRPGRAFAQ